MKKLVISFFLFFVSFTVQSQNLKSVDEFDFVIATKKIMTLVKIYLK